MWSPISLGPGNFVSLRRNLKWVGRLVISKHYGISFAKDVKKLPDSGMILVLVWGEVGEGCLLKGESRHHLLFDLWPSKFSFSEFRNQIDSDKRITLWNVNSCFLKLRSQIDFFLSNLLPKYYQNWGIK